MILGVLQLHYIGSITLITNKIIRSNKFLLAWNEIRLGISPVARILTIIPVRSQWHRYKLPRKCHVLGDLNDLPSGNSLLKTAHWAHWFTELGDGDFPVRYVNDYQRVTNYSNAPNDLCRRVGHLELRKTSSNLTSWLRTEIGIFFLGCSLAGMGRYKWFMEISPTIKWWFFMIGYHGKIFHEIWDWQEILTQMM